MADAEAGVAPYQTPVEAEPGSAGEERAPADTGSAGEVGAQGTDAVQDTARDSGLDAPNLPPSEASGHDGLAQLRSNVILGAQIQQFAAAAEAEEAVENEAEQRRKRVASLAETELAVTSDKTRSAEAGLLALEEDLKNKMAQAERARSLALQCKQEDLENFEKDAARKLKMLEDEGIVQDCEVNHELSVGFPR